jgi:hypothetical protein
VWSQRRHHEVHRIADQQGNPIPGLDAFLKQAGGHPPGCRTQLGAGQRAIQVLDGGPIRGSIGVVQHRTEYAAGRHAFSQVVHAQLFSLAGGNHRNTPRNVRSPTGRSVPISRSALGTRERCVPSGETLISRG